MNETNFDSLNDFRKIRQLRKITNLTDEQLSKKSSEELNLINKLKLEERRLTYKYDFLAFILEVMDAERKGEDPSKLGNVHRRLCRAIRTTKNLGRNMIIRIPRYHLKTQICTIYYRIWRCVNSPENCSIIVSGTLELSKDTARVIRQEFGSNAKLKMLYPNVLPDWIKNERRNKWAETEFNVARTGNYAQCSIEAVGVDATVTGKHFSEISFDDVVTRENSTTAEQCEKVIRAYKFFLSIVNTKRFKGRIPIMIVGTNYTDHDLYSFLDQKEIKELFDEFVQPVFYNDGTLIWPEHHTQESIALIRATQGVYMFSTQYLLDPVPEEQQEIKRAWIQTYKEVPLDADGNQVCLEKRIIVDPITAKKTSSTSNDRGVVLVVGWDKRLNLFILDYKLYDRAKESELFDGIFQLSDKWTTHTVLWESVAYQVQGKYNLEEKALQYGKHLKVKEVRPGHTDKDVRIRTLVPHFERGQIYIRYWMNELIQELLRFPHGKTDDIIDTLTYALKEMFESSGRGKKRWNGTRLMQPSSDQPFYL